MNSAKQIIFRYNDDPASEEIELDMDGEKLTPSPNDLIDRKGERWKVLKVSVETNAAEPFAIPIHRVFLASPE
jgi:hypothetical protein